MKIIRPQDVEPLVNPSTAAQREGRHTHRRILSYPKGGPSTIDVGYNSSVGELDLSIPYAYSKDEYCYNVRGSVRLVNDGEILEAGRGVFMWRPAGAPTHRISLMDDYGSICVFGPARTDDWSHRLEPEEIGKWDGDPASKPRAQFRAVDDVAPGPFAGADVAGSVIHRQIFDTPHMEVTHSILEEGASLDIDAHDREDVYWLESGAVAIGSGDKALMWNAGEFLQVRPNEQIGAIGAQERSVMLRWSAPAG